MSLDRNKVYYYYYYYYYRNISKELEIFFETPENKEFFVKIYECLPI